MSKIKNLYNHMKWDKHQHSNDMGHKWTERVRGAVFEGKSHRLQQYSGGSVLSNYNVTAILI